MSHRSKVYDTIIKEAEADLRTLLGIPDNYTVLFLQGGASTQFAMIPMNFMKNRKAGYIVTGQWAKKAFAEAKLFGEAVELASSADRDIFLYSGLLRPAGYGRYGLCIYLRKQYDLRNKV